MKTLLQRGVEHLKEKIKVLFGFRPLAPMHIVNPENDENLYDNIFLKLKDNPVLKVNSKEVALLRKRVHRYERVRMRGNIEAARAFRALINYLAAKLSRY